jgi:hypothetical protein
VVNSTIKSPTMDTKSMTPSPTACKLGTNWPNYFMLSTISCWSNYLC